MTMMRKFLVTIICTSIVVAITISTYNYYTIDFTAETESSSLVEDRAKGGAMIYPKKIGGDEWFMDFAK